LHGDEGEGEDFRSLGSLIDPTLRMETNIQNHCESTPGSDGIASDKAVL